MVETGTKTRGTLKVFISYSRKDMAFADRLDAALVSSGLEVLIDRSEIYAFEDWWIRIQNLISQSDTVAFVLSPDAVASEVCRKEVEFAASLNKRFAPIVWRRVERHSVPSELSRLNFVFFDDESRFETSLAQLVQALQTDIDWVRLHTEFGQAARTWMANKWPKGLLLRSPLLEQAERWILATPASACAVLPQSAPDRPPSSGPWTCRRGLGSDLRDRDLYAYRDGRRSASSLHMAGREARKAEHAPRPPDAARSPHRAD